MQGGGGGARGHSPGTEKRERGLGGKRVGIKSGDETLCHDDIYFRTRKHTCGKTPHVMPISTIIFLFFRVRVVNDCTDLQLCEVFDHEPHAGVDGLVVGQLLQESEELLHVQAVVFVVQCRTDCSDQLAQSLIRFRDARCEHHKS